MPSFSHIPPDSLLIDQCCKCAHIWAVQVKYSAQPTVDRVTAGNDDLRAGKHVAGDVVLNQFCIISNQCLHFTGTLAALPLSQVDFSAGDNVPIADVLSNKNLSIVVWLLIVEADKAEVCTKNL